MATSACHLLMRAQVAPDGQSPGFRKNMIQHLRFLASSTFLLIALASSRGAAPETTKWGYDGKTGPNHWAELAREFHLCRDGKRQSPIDLRADQAFPVRGNPLRIAYRPDTVDELNNGYTVQEIIHNGSGVTFDGRHYQLAQFHFHCHSEHTIDGEALPMEIHFVHQGEGGRLLVIGVLFKEGKTNSALEPMLRHLPRKPGAHEIDERDRIDINALIPKNSAIFTYDGSLTTPPASEGVRWFVYRKPLTASSAQLKKLRALYDHNFRPAQPLNGRMVALIQARARATARKK